VGAVIVLAPARLGLLGLGGVALFGGLTGALVLLGVWAPVGAGRLAAGHGLLMTLGFLGTLIALERAVALGKVWGYAAPLATGLGGIAIVLGAPASVAGALLGLGAMVFLALYVAFDRIERTLHTSIQAVGAVAWVVAMLLLLTGRTGAEIVPWLAAFLVLTICGERLELSRLARLSAVARRAFAVAASVFLAGVVVSVALPDVGVRLAGLGLVALAAWLARNDVARRTVRRTGVTRFVAVSMLAGYAWLTVAGIVWLVFGAASTGPARDAALHALFLGFVISMVFGHAPVILPAVLRVPLPYHPRFYAHLVLLHTGLVLRVFVGDFGGVSDALRLGGVLNVVALLVFVGSSALSTVRGVQTVRYSTVVRRVEEG
jgi:hypothetical protein